MNSVSHDNMPQAIEHLIKVVENIQETVQVISSKGTKTDEDAWFNITQLSQYLPDHPAKQTIYEWASQKLIPYHKKTKRLMFLKSEIDEWIKASRRKTMVELEKEALEHIASTKRY